jgi:CHAD domain-containing protein
MASHREVGFLERERKLDVPDDFTLPAIDGDLIPARRLDARYFDAPDLRLARLGITLRHRVEDGQGRWQLKLPEAGARRELEFPGEPDEPPQDFRSLLVGVLGRRDLGVVAEMRTDRHGVIARGDDETAVAEVVIDHVSATPRHGVPVHFVEAEIELRPAAPERLMDQLELQLREAGARVGDGRSKLGRVLRLNEQLAASDGPPILRVVEAHRDSLLRADPEVRLDLDVEAVHDARVAVRRLRSVLRTGREAFDRSWLHRARGELKWLGARLGDVRDLDVLAEAIERQGAELEPADQPGVRALVETVQRQRDGSFRTLIAAMESDRYLDLLELLDEPALSARAPRRSLKRLARAEHRRTERDHRQLGKAPSGEQLHELRKQVKRARYAAEPVTSRRARRYVEAAKRLQDVLGEHQDAVVEEQRLRDLAGVTTTAGAFAAGRLRERQEQRMQQAEAELPKAWRRFRKVRPSTW